MLVITPRFAEAWRRFLQLVSGEVPPLRAVPEMAAHIGLSPADFELWVHLGWGCYSTTLFVAANGAGTRSKCKLACPANTNLIVECLSASASAAVAARVFVAGIVDATALPQGAIGIVRDHRLGRPNVINTLPMASVTADNVTGTGMGATFARLPCAQSGTVNMLLGTPLILRQNRAIIIEPDTDNQDILVNFVWRERLALPSELNVGG